MVNLTVSNSVMTGVRDNVSLFRMGGGNVYGFTREEPPSTVDSVHTHDRFFEKEPVLFWEEAPPEGWGQMHSTCVLDGTVAGVRTYDSLDYPRDSRVYYGDTALETYTQYYDEDADFEFRISGERALHIVSGPSYLFVLGMNFSNGLYSTVYWVDRFTRTVTESVVSWAKTRIHEYTYTDSTVLIDPNRYSMAYSNGRVYLGLHAGQQLTNASFTRIITVEGALVAQTPLYGNVDGLAVFARIGAGNDLLFEAVPWPGNGVAPYLIVRSPTGAFYGTYPLIDLPAVFNNSVQDIAIYAGFMHIAMSAQGLGDFVRIISIVWAEDEGGSFVTVSTLEDAVFEGSYGVESLPRYLNHDGVSL